MGVFDARAASSTCRMLSAAATDNATVAVARPCALKGIQGHNAKASAVYLKLYDKATAPASTDTPKKTIYLPASLPFIFAFTAGIEFSLGLGFRFVTGNADNDATAVSAADILALNLDYL